MKLVIIVAAFLFMTSCSNSNSENINYNLTPVLLVHGSGLNSESWGKLKQYFIRHGYPAEYIYAVDLTPNNGRNIIAAQTQLKPAVDKLLFEALDLCTKSNSLTCNMSKVDIVAHSMGAVSSRWYATRVHPEKVRKFVSIAGANHGTNALCGLKGDGNKEMCPAYSMDVEKNRVQVLLNSDPIMKYDQTPYGAGYDKDSYRKLPPDSMRKIYYFTLRIENDEWIVPDESGNLEGAGGVENFYNDSILFIESPKGNFKLSKKLAHDSLPQDVDVISFIQKLLQVSVNQ